MFVFRALRMPLFCLLLGSLALPGPQRAFAAQKERRIIEQAAQAYEGKNYAMVKQILKPLLETNHPESAFLMGLMAARAEDGPQDLRAAAAWWQIAADGENALAQFNLGYLYFKGGIGPPDFVKARELWTRAAAQKQIDALYGLALLQSNGIGGDRDMAAGVKNLQAAAGKGHPLAEYLLGQAYLEGAGLKADRKKAREYFTKAADKGISEAKSALEAMDEEQRKR
jgi:TPR repeat protein